MKLQIKVTNKRIFFAITFLILFLSAFVEVKAQYGVPGPGGLNSINRTGYACTSRYLNCSGTSGSRNNNIVEDIELRRAIPKKPQGYTYDRTDVLLAEIKTLYGDQSSFMCYNSAQSSNLIDIAAPANLISGELKYKLDTPAYQSIVVDRGGKLFIDYLLSQDTIVAAIENVIGGGTGDSGNDVTEEAKELTLKRVLSSYLITSISIFDAKDDYLITEQYQQLLDVYKQNLRISSSDGNKVFTLPNTTDRSVLNSIGANSDISDVLAAIYFEAALGIDVADSFADESGVDEIALIADEVIPLIQSQTSVSAINTLLNSSNPKKLNGQSFTDDELDLVFSYFDSLKYISNYFQQITSDSRQYDYFGLSSAREVVTHEANLQSVGNGILDLSSFNAFVTQLHSTGNSQAIELVKNNIGGGFENFVNLPASQKYLFAGQEIIVINTSSEGAASLGTTLSCKNAGGCALVSSGISKYGPETSERGEVKATDRSFQVVTTEEIRSYTQSDASTFGQLSCQRCYANGEAMAIEELTAGNKYNVYICDTSAPGNVRVKESVGSLDATLGSLITDPTNQPLYDSCFESGGIYTAIGCVDPTPMGIITGLIRISLGVIGGVALLQLIYVGIQYQMGDEAKIKEARSRLIATITGVAVLIFSILILRIIGVNILDVLPAGAI